MFIYLFILLVFFTCYFINNQSKRDGADKVLALCVIFALTVIAGIRYDVGMDYMAYKDIFLEVNTEWANTMNKNIEVGYWLINRCIYVIGGNYQSVFMILAAVSYYLFYKFISFFSPNIFFSLLVFICLGQLYLNSFNAVRQFLAMAIFAYSTRYIYQRKLIKYIIGIILAVIFGHTSALLLAACYPLSKKINVYIKCVIIILIVAFPSIIVALMENSEQYAIYLKMTSFTRETQRVTYLYLVLSSFIMFKGSTILEDYKYKNLILNMNFCFLILCVMMILFSNSPVIELVNRFSYYFIIFYTILIPALIKYIKNSQLKFIASAFTATTLILLFLRASIWMGEQYNLLPFKFSFDFIK